MKIDKKLIKLLIKKKSLKQKDVAAQLEVSQQDFNNWMFRGVIPHYDKLNQLAEILETDVNELYTADNSSEPLQLYGKKHTFSPEDLIPFYELDQHVRLSAIWKNDGSLEPKDYVYIPGLKVDFFMTYYGSGMEPKLENGDWIALRKVSDLTHFNFGCIHLLSTKEQTIIRTLSKGDTEENIKLSAENKKIDAILISKESIKGLYIVDSIIKRNLI